MNSPESAYEFESDPIARRLREMIWNLVDLFGLSGFKIKSSERNFMHKTYRRDRRLKKFNPVNFTDSILVPEMYKNPKGIIPKGSYDKENLRGWKVFCSMAQLGKVPMKWKSKYRVLKKRRITARDHLPENAEHLKTKRTINSMLRREGLT